MGYFCMQEMMEGAAAPEAPAMDAPAQESDDAIVDQIGALLQKLAPEKQAEVIAQLSEMLGGGEPAPEADAGAVPVEGGAGSKPFSYGG